jgi:hypothetical protein
MLLQTNSYIVPKEKRAEHARLMRRFRQVLNRLGCDSFEVYEQVGANWSNTQTSGRFVQIMRFRDRKHQLAVQGAERTDPSAQELIAEFCDLVNYPYQQQQGQFAVGFYSSVLPLAPARPPRRPGDAPHDEAVEPNADAAMFGTPVSETGVPAESEAAAFADAAEPASEPATAGDLADAELIPFDQTEAEQEAAADEFAQAAEKQEGESPASPESAEPITDDEAAIELEDDDTALPALDAETELDAEALTASTPPLDATPGANGAEHADPLSPEALEPEAAPGETPAATIGDFDLDDLGAPEDLEMTDDDLARLAQELSPENPPHNGQGGATDPAANPR